MAKGCLALLFGFTEVTNSRETVDTKTIEMNEGEIHSGPGGYEGMGYSGGYAADYMADSDHSEGE